MDRVSIPRAAYELLMTHAKRAGELSLVEYAHANAIITAPMEAFPMDGTPVAFHTVMTVRYQPYVAQSRLAAGEIGRWQWMHQGQWVKLEKPPEGTWAPLP